MIQIKFAGLDFVYELLEKNPNLARIRTQDSGDWWKGENVDEGAEIMKKMAGFKYNAIELPPPLDHTNLVIRRVGNFYTASVPVVPREKWAFDGLSEELAESFSKRGKVFVSTTDDGTGYVFDERKRVAAVIMAFGRDDEVRDIAIGGSGAYERKFDDEESFVIGVGGLEKDVNTFLDACFKRAFAKCKIREIPDYTLTLVS